MLPPHKGYLSLNLECLGIPSLIKRFKDYLSLKLDLRDPNTNTYK